jgi:2-polyprenyl-3-methyl-5-hydroxy-6-metoxy-1,4-benzoquinol methylase
MSLGASPIANEAAIRTEPKPNCALCGRKGETHYSRQHDRLFATPGLWGLNRCPNRDCGLIWLDPMPLREDLGKAYFNYYTHAPESAPASSRSSFCRQFELIYIRDHFGYPSPSPKFWAKFLGFLFFHREGGSTFVEWKPGGKLLDVGCGAGGYLQFMRSLGWTVEGVEFDSAAVEAARCAGLTIRCGSLEEQAYSSSSFDVITLQHVIEHVPDPVATLAECARILRPGGKLVLFTPNSSSLTHRVFKECWRGLEPPRHLHIFSPASARRALNMAGFQEVTIRPQAAASIISESIRLRHNSKGIRRRSRDGRFLREFVRVAAFLEGCLARCRPSLADCLAAVAAKR